MKIFKHLSLVGFIAVIGLLNYAKAEGSAPCGQTADGQKAVVKEAPAVTPTETTESTTSDKAETTEPATPKPSH